MGDRAVAGRQLRLLPAPPGVRRPPSRWRAGRGAASPHRRHRQQRQPPGPAVSPVPTTIALVHGAYHGAWCWELVAPELSARGFRVVAPDLPCDDPDAGLVEYAAAVEDAIGD